jgi:hypothetical protein
MNVLNVSFQGKDVDVFPVSEKKIESFKEKISVLRTEPLNISFLAVKTKLHSIQYIVMTL